MALVAFGAGVGGSCLVALIVGARMVFPIPPPPPPPPNGVCLDKFVPLGAPDRICTLSQTVIRYSPGWGLAKRMTWVALALGYRWAHPALVGCRLGACVGMLLGAMLYSIFVHVGMPARPRSGLKEPSAPTSRAVHCTTHFTSIGYVLTPNDKAVFEDFGATIHCPPLKSELRHAPPARTRARTMSASPTTCSGRRSLWSTRVSSRE